MPAPATNDDFLNVARKSQQVDMDRLEAYLGQRQSSDTLPPDPKKLAALLVREGLLTGFQAEQFLQGKHRGFSLGGYRILDRLGAGGTGTVYRAEHEVMRRQVALKVLPALSAKDEGVLERFRREAQAAAALDHPNIVHAYDFRHEGGMYFLVLEYVHGPSLAEVIERQGALEPAVACDYVRQAAIGLDHAHQAGLVHRDVKPGNLLVDDTGTVKVLDLGLARFAPEGQQSLTRQFDENAVMGTADYIAPEQALNLHEVDARADLYSLGATLYALIAGEPPFSSGTMTQKLLWHQMKDPVPLRKRQPNCPPEVADIVARMMAKAPEDRYQSAAEVADALEPFAAEAPTPQAPPRSGTPAPRPSPYVKGTGGPRSATRADAVAKPRSATRRDAIAPPDQRNEPAPEPEGIPRPKIATDVRLRPAAGTVPAGEGMGIAVLTGLIGACMLVIGGVVAYLIWAPAPRAPQGPAVTGEAPPDPPRPAPPVFRLPDGNRELFALQGHDRPVTAVALTFPEASGRMLAASASEDGSVRVWDLEKRAELDKIVAGGAVPRSVAFSADRHRLLSAWGERGVMVYDLQARQPLRWFAREGAPVQAVYNHGEGLVVTAGADGAVRTFDTGNGKRTKLLRGHQGPAHAVASRPLKPAQALSGGEDGTVRLWDLNNQKLIRQFRHPTGKAPPKPRAGEKAKPRPSRPAHARACLAVAFSPDGRRAATAGADGLVHYWEVDNGRLLFTVTVHLGPIRAVALGHDGRHAASGGDDLMLRLWSTEKDRNPRAHAGHGGAIHALAWTFDGRHVVTAGKDHTVRVWAVK